MEQLRNENYEKYKKKVIKKQNSNNKKLVSKIKLKKLHILKTSKNSKIFKK